MGIVYRAICPCCSYKNDFCLGSGLRSINLLQSIRVLEEKEQKVITHMHENGEIDSFVIENKLTECAKCNVLEEKTIIKLKDNKAEKIFGNRCGSCGGELHLYDEVGDCDLFKVKCPKCKEALLKFSRVGHWD